MFQHSFTVSQADGATLITFTGNALGNQVVYLSSATAEMLAAALSHPIPHPSSSIQFGDVEGHLAKAEVDAVHW